jgi:hypothetical protein
MTGIALCTFAPACICHFQIQAHPANLPSAYSTFLKRKGGLFKKAHELSVLCQVDVAVFIFGNNKKLYEYSNVDMRELVTRYTYVCLAVSSAFECC